MLKTRLACSLTLFLASVSALPASAQMQRPLNADSFKLGSGGGVLCQVQSRGRDQSFTTIFDRAWSIVCRDAARPIGKLYALRGDQAAIEQRLSQVRAAEASCAAGASESVDDIGAVASLPCQMTGANVGYKVITFQKGGVTWVAEGLSAYDSALKLGLRSVFLDRSVPGQVSVATTSIDDPVAFARVQAGSLDPDKALAEGYRRNNSGDYAEAAEFFDTLQQRLSGSATETDRRGEYLINQALQKSNLGEFGEADTLFAEARKMPANDKVQSRLRRNFEAMHLLNQKRYDDALAAIRRSVVPIDTAMRMPGSAIEIGVQVAAEINSGIPVTQRLGATETGVLSPDERSQFLDAQASQLEGTLLRLKGQPAAARPMLERALADVISIRNGRVVSVIRLRSQILAETGLAFEDEGKLPEAEQQLRESVSLLQTRYPQTVAVNGARARLAAFLMRNGKRDLALAEYRAVIDAAVNNQAYTTGLGNLLAPYFSALADMTTSDPQAVTSMFLASQTLARPGVADTQAVLARELSEGDSDAARLFRQSRNLTRDIERSRIDLAALANAPDQTAEIRSAIAAIQMDIATLERDQSATQAQLAAFPQFRAISSKAVDLTEFRTSLKPGEAYFKVMVVGRSVFALFIDGEGATGYKLPVTSERLDTLVDALRETIAKEEAAGITTYPFDIIRARELYEALLGPVDARLKSAKHVIFEPDGAMLRLPLNLLVTTQESVDRYLAKVQRPKADEFDLTGVEWLGRGRSVSTAVSVRAFRDARNTPVSQAKRQYIGFGQNAPLTGAIRRAGMRSLTGGNSVNCEWPNSQWNAPISAAELQEAQAIIGVAGSEIVTGAAFSDTSIIARKDLSDYRILHFATHGLVTAPKPECPARPALLTSFGGAESDGLLTFREIFDLKLDADIVILSACDTAGKATIAATREAGVTSGGGSALDGLVRAFIGAGGRAVMASHWPVPDDFNATERLITGLFRATPGTSIGDAIGAAERALMDDPETSHPYYWSGFAIVGDGALPLLGAR